MPGQCLDTDADLAFQQKTKNNGFSADDERHRQAFQ